MEWQPIETAPKDDKQVPLWNPDNPHGEWPYMGVWDAIRQAWTVHVDGQIIYPTHWMPLPDPPTALPSIEEMSGSIDPDCEIFETRKERENA